MTEPRIYIPKAVAFQRSAKLVSSASRQIDNGVPLSEAHVVALLEYFEFLAPEQFTSMMGPGLCAEFSAVTEHEFPLSVLKERAPLFQLLLDHTTMFASAFLHDGEDTRAVIASGSVFARKVLHLDRLTATPAWLPISRWP